MEVRIAAASGLGRVGPSAEPAVHSLCECLGSANELLRWHASFALGKIGAAAVPSLRSMMHSPEPVVALSAVDALEWIGENAKDALDDLKGLSKSASWPLLQLACYSALAKISGDASSAVPMIQVAMSSVACAGPPPVMT